MSGLSWQMWGDDERDEYNAMLREIVASTPDTSERLDMFARLLDDALNAHRFWARDVQGSCLRAGMAKEIKRFQDRERAMVGWNGRLLSKPRIQGTQRRDSEGRVHHARELIELWTWAEIEAKRAQVMHTRATATESIAYYDRLLSLRERCPGATGPAEAADLLGLDLEEYVAGSAA